MKSRTNCTISTGMESEPQTVFQIPQLPTMTTGSPERRLGQCSGHEATRRWEDMIRPTQRLFLLFIREEVRMARLGARNGGVGNEFTGDYLSSGEGQRNSG